MKRGLRYLTKEIVSTFASMVLLSSGMERRMQMLSIGKPKAGKSENALRGKATASFQLAANCCVSLADSFFVAALVLPFETGCPLSSYRCAAGDVEFEDVVVYCENR